MKPEQSLIERLRKWKSYSNGIPSHPEICTEAALALQDKDARIEQLERQLAAPAELPPLPKHRGYVGPDEHYNRSDMIEYARAAQRAELQPLTDEQIRETFLANGFTIKEGNTDLKPYVYAAARALLAQRAAPTAQGSGKDAPLSDEQLESLTRYDMVEGRGMLSGRVIFSMDESCSGEYVRFDDVRALLAQPAAPQEAPQQEPKEEG